MLRGVFTIRLITFSNILFSTYPRSVKKIISQKWLVPKFRSFAISIGTLIPAFVQIVNCSEASQVMDASVKSSKETDKNLSSSIIQSDEYYKVGKFEESYSILQCFEELENAEVLWRLARCLHDMAKQSGIKSSEKTEKIEKAFKLVTRALELDYKNYAVHKWMAILLDAKNSLDGLKARIKGMPDFKRHLLYAMELNPKDATTIYILGQYCYNIADMTWYQRKIASALFGTPPEATFEEALHFFSRAEEVEPNFYSLNLLMLGKTYLKLKKTEQARYWLKCASSYPVRTEEDKEALFACSGKLFISLTKDCIPDHLRASTVALNIMVVMCEKSYFPNYYSIEDILVTQEKVPCKTITAFRRLGWLKPGNDSEDLSADTALDLPLWMILKLMRKVDLIKIDIPKVYQERVRDIFEADAKVINLFRVNQHYYEFGIYLCSLNIKENELIQNIITQTFRERFRVILDWADNIMTEASKIQQLDNSEKSLLKCGHKARTQLDAWLTEGSSKMEAAEMVVNLKKRKLLSLDGD